LLRAIRGRPDEGSTIGGAGIPQSRKSLHGPQHGSVRLTQFDQQASGAAWMDEEDTLTISTASGCLVDELKSALLEPPIGRIQVVYLESEMMQALTAPSNKLRNRRVLAERLQQL